MERSGGLPLLVALTTTLRLSNGVLRIVNKLLEGPDSENTSLRLCAFAPLR
jgi:hypothetical protein